MTKMSHTSVCRLPCISIPYSKAKPGLVGQNCNPKAGEMEAGKSDYEGRLQLWCGLPGLHETLSKNKRDPAGTVTHPLVLAPQRLRQWIAKTARPAWATEQDSLNNRNKIKSNFVS